MVNIIITSDPRYKINKPALHETILNVLKKYGFSNQTEVEINVVGDRKMHDLNKEYRKIDSSTDVLSFSLTEGGKSGFVANPDKILRLGSIVISYPFAIQNASEEGISVDEEINFLGLHGLNHLLGIHHE
ncbi:MAG: rRNA maturation RNase YbeY [Candidatus Daviesbacteria bacterium]|nr:rRNA maturation RNase YbeY [Candidatus Daviesbacteria bacterium]